MWVRLNFIFRNIILNIKDYDKKCKKYLEKKPQQKEEKQQEQPQEKQEVEEVQKQPTEGADTKEEEIIRNTFK